MSKEPIAAIQEIKQKGNSITEIGNYIFSNSGNENRIPRKKEPKRSSHVQTNLRKISLINIHAPTEKKDLETKTEYYEESLKEYQKIPKYDIKIIIGDTNAKIGKEQRYRHIIGKQRKQHDSKKHSFCTQKIHKGTWISPDGKTINHINRVLIDKRNAQLITNIRSYRGAESSTDHILVIVHTEEEMPKKEKIDRAQQDIDLRKFKEGIQQQYEQKLTDSIKKNRKTDSLEEKWEMLQNIIWTTKKGVIRFKTSHTNKAERFDDERKTALETGRKARETYMRTRKEEHQKQYQQEYMQKQKRTNMEAQIRQIEENLCKKEIKNFYQDVKQKRKGYQPKVIYYKDKEGNLIGDEQATVKRWTEYFEELLNEQTTNQGISEFSNNRREDLNEILKQMKNNQTPGSNGIRPEMLKYGGEEFVEEIHRLIVECWKSG
ncbi:uncharacterized protein LOC135138600 [Zophobas morio]|uniref:uncharacterized protein LOC135138600 n=1 Tax=Zophobas morio TaxID=2755281 RepID=UPI00308278F2